MKVPGEEGVKLEATSLQSVSHAGSCSSARICTAHTVVPWGPIHSLQPRLAAAGPGWCWGRNGIGSCEAYSEAVLVPSLRDPSVCSVLGHTGKGRDKRIKP